MESTQLGPSLVISSYCRHVDRDTFRDAHFQLASIPPPSRLGQVRSETRMASPCSSDGHQVSRASSPQFNDIQRSLLLGPLALELMSP